MNKQILIVEDDAEIRGVLNAVLTGSYRVSEVASGTSLRRSFTGEAPDVVLLDLHLGDAN